jgi:hypothetical protein
MTVCQKVIWNIFDYIELIAPAALASGIMISLTIDKGAVVDKH